MVTYILRCREIWGSEYFKSPVIPNQLDYFEQDQL